MLKYLMIRDISPIQLGGSLYIPATHKNVFAVCNEHKYPALRSCIIDTEDAILADDLDSALENISKMLDAYKPSALCVFIRPRNPHILQKILQLKNIEKIDGFSLPKYSTEVMKEYSQIISLSQRKFYIMPVLESHDLFSIKKLESIRDFLLKCKIPTLTLRLGGEDMMNYLGLKRKCEDNIYSLVGPAQVIANVINTFKPFGFNVSATVFNCIKQGELFEQNILEDLKQGLMGKTIIHPNQIKPINNAYKVSQDEFEMAKKMLDKQTDAIIVHKGQMGEKFAHGSWAKTTLLRQKYYGLKEDN